MSNTHRPLPSPVALPPDPPEEPEQPALPGLTKPKKKAKGSKAPQETAAPTFTPWMGLPYQPRRAESTARERLGVRWANFRNWLDDKRPAPPPIPEDWWTPLRRHPDPLTALIDTKRNSWRNQLYLGLNQRNEPAGGAEDAPLLVLGPSGSLKTAGLMIQNVLLAPGACFCVSSRRDIFKATARVRSRFGTVWHFSPVGTRMPGAKSVHYDPFRGSEDPTVAQATGRRWASMIDRSEYALIAGNSGHLHFRERGAAFIAAVARVSQLWTYDNGDRRGVGWAITFLQAPRYVAAVNELDRELEHHENGEQLRAEMAELKFLFSISDEERGSVLTTVANALGAYRDPAVVRAAMTGKSFDFDAFVCGEPDKTLLGMHGFDNGVLGRHGVYPLMKGRFDTVYVTEASAESPTAFILMDFEFRIRQAMYRYSEQLEMEEA